MTKQFQPTCFYVEFDWTGNRYRFRINRQFIDIRGVWSCPDLASVRQVLAECDWQLGPKSAKRSWTVLERNPHAVVGDTP